MLSFCIMLNNLRASSPHPF
uniref:Uncharacterized protein n=1 Tax=Rhizophora mucronata TaxID=61149 RepID=A0A2P2PE78_RHIMU